MRIAEGTKQVTQLFQRLRREGDLVDLYSDSFLEKLRKRGNNPSCKLFAYGIEYVEAIESDPENEIYPRGHLLFIFLDDYKPDIHRMFVSVYAPLAYLINETEHRPDFLILNLYTRQVLCMGLGRKNGLFVIDAETKKYIGTDY